MTPKYRCWAEVNLDALRENLAWIRHRVGPQVRVMAVVKADAYGHGLKPSAGLMMQSGADLFGVANLIEARAIRSVGKGWPILMLGACLPEEVEQAVRDRVMPTISSVEEARWFSVCAVKARSVVDVHLKVDTGMGRLGVSPDHALDLAVEIRKFQGLRLQGLYTHFSSAEDDAEFSQEQAKKFHTILTEFGRRRIEVPLIHANNSAALLHEPETIFNCVRPGLLVYGIIPPGKRIGADAVLRRQIQPALSWKCRVSLVKEIARGTPLSYGHTCVARRRTKVATLTAGYGDGYPRAATNRGFVLIGGVRCGVLGRVTMDQMLADVSKISAVANGDEAVLIGRQASEEITASEVAAWSDTVPWEILTGITQRVPRLYHGGHAA